MTLTPDDLRACRYVAAEVIRNRRHFQQPIPAWLRGLDRRLDAELRASSAHGTETEAGQQNLEMVGTAEAARILECSTRWVRRIAADLDGQRTGRDWIFRRATVTEYATARKEP